MKQYVKILAACFALLSVVACRKEGIQIENAPAANVTFVNASPGAPSVDVYIDTAKHSPASLAYLSNTQQTTLTPPLLYNPVLAGSRKVEVRSSSTPTSTMLAANYDFEAGKNYSVFLYDTASKRKFLRLTDDLTPLADSALAKVRFLNLSPLSTVASIDVTLLRTSVTPSDSITFANQLFIGNATPNESALSAFTTVKAGVYTVKFKQAGTQTVIAQATGVNIGTTGVSASVVRSKILTLFLTGGVASTQLTLRTLRHY